MSKERAVSAHILAAIAAGASCQPQNALARDGDFYAGKTVTIVVANPAGSGYDAYARLLGRHIVKYIAGKPTIIVQNMPGAGGIKGADYTGTLAPRDGTTFALLVPGALTEPLVSDAKKFRYDPTKFGYVGTMDSGTRLCLTSHKSKIKSMADAQKAKANVGTTAPGSSSYQYPMFTNALAGTKFNTITGYQGPPDIFVALERGEVDGACGFDISTFTALRPAWLEGPAKANPILQYGLESNEYATRLGFPSIWNFVKEEDKALVRLIVSQQVFQRPFVTPPGVPGAQLEVLQSAFANAMTDLELVAEANKSKLSLNPKGGVEVAELVKQMYAAPKPMIDRMKTVIRP
jgi:tripartite-type tricarboxylate transporter receptor subunit TctC